MPCIASINAELVSRGLFDLRLRDEEGAPQ